MIRGILTGLFLAGTVVTAQTPVRDQPHTPRTGTGVIRGRVVRNDTGEPLRRVEVRVDEWNTKDQGGPAATMTDAEGRYELTLAAGQYQLKASRGGYVEVAYGQRRPFERGRPIQLGEGVVLENINFALPPGGVVTGRIFDETGEVFPRVSVWLARRRYFEGEKRLVGEVSSSSDDRGEFRIFGVPPGEYVVIANFEERDFGSRDRVRYVPTYFPGTPVATEAQRITVGPGQQVSGIVIALARAATAAVRGTVRSSSQSSSGPFTLVSAQEIGGPQAYGHVATAIAGSDGSFVIAGLLPGKYVLDARSTLGSESGSTEVAVEGSDINGVSLILSAGATVRGRVRFDTGKPPAGLSPSEVFVMPAFLDQQRGGMDMRSGPPVVRDD